MGEVKLGRAKTIADGITSAEDKEYGVLNNSKYVPTNGNTVGYTFKGIDGLVLGANYLLAQERSTSDFLVLQEKLVHKNQQWRSGWCKI